MKLDVWEALDPIRLTGEQVRQAFVWQQSSGSAVNNAFHLLLPSPWEIYLRLELTNLLTPLEAKNYSGFRLVRTGQFPVTVRVAEITRVDERIIRREELDSRTDVVYALVHKFFDVISVRFSDLCQRPGFLTESEGGTVVYSASLVESLLIDSLTKPQKPRLMPLLVLPTEEAILDALRDLIEPQIPFSIEYIGGAYSMTKSRDQFEMKHIGERGEIIEEHRSPELSKVTLHFIRSLFDFERVENDSCWTFDPFSLGDQHF